jgi:hypothetical protein
MHNFAEIGRPLGEQLNRPRRFLETPLMRPLSL